MITLNDHNISSLDKPPEPFHRNILINCHIQTGDRVLVSDDGFVCVFNQNEEQVVKILNTIFASARLLLHIPLDIVRKTELCNFEWRPLRRQIKLTGYALVERNMACLQRDEKGGSFENWRSSYRVVVNSEGMIKTIRFAYWILQNKDLHTDLLLLFDGFTLFNKGACTASFLYGWMMIETFLSKIWNEYVDSLRRSGKDKEALKDHNRWTTFHHIAFSVSCQMHPALASCLEVSKTWKPNLQTTRSIMVRVSKT
jgi:hypothetical protein